jgi:hypothetical protein
MNIIYDVNTCNLFELLSYPEFRNTNLDAASFLPRQKVFGNFLK